MQCHSSGREGQIPSCADLPAIPLDAAGVFRYNECGEGLGRSRARRGTEERRRSMEYRRFQDTLIVRIDRDEEILAQLRAVAEQEGVRLASVEALGAVSDFTVCVYDVTEKKFYSNRFQGAYEIVSLTGTVSTKDGAF